MAQSRTDRLLLGCGALAPALFILVFTVTGALRTGYDPLYHPVSALSLGDHGWLQIANFVITGALLTMYAVGVRRALRPGPGSRAGPLLLGLLGVALVLSGMFVMDPMRGFPPGTPESAPAAGTVSHTVHDLAGMVVFAALPTAAFVLARWFSRTGRPGWRWYSLATGVAGVVLFGAFGVAWEADHAASGLVQRVMILVGFGWVALTALRLRADQPPADHPPLTRPR